VPLAPLQTLKTSDRRGPGPHCSRKDSTVLNNVASLGADIYNLGALTLNDSTVGVIGP
jgi:hypothetical protein